MDVKKLQTLILEAAKDEPVRKRLLRDPRGAMREADFELPKDMDIEVHENGPDTIHEVLPVQQEGVLEAWKKFNRYGAAIVERAWNDPQYKKKLFSDPRAAFMEVADIKLPDSLKLYVHENTRSKFHLIVPYIIPAAGELSDADLEVVAGGKGDPMRCGEGIGIGAEVAVEGGIHGGQAGGAAGAGVGVAIGGIVAGLSALISWLK